MDEAPGDRWICAWKCCDALFNNKVEDTIHMKHGSLAIAVSALFSLSVVFCLQLSCGVNTTSRLGAPVAEQLRESASMCLKARAINPRSWERMWIIGPYVNARDLDDFPWRIRRSIKASGIEERDDIAVLLFVHAGDDYELFVERRSPVDFVSAKSLLSINTYSPDEPMCFSKSNEPPFAFVLQASEQPRNE